MKLEKRGTTQIIQNHEEDCGAVRMVENDNWDVPWSVARAEYKVIEDDQYLVLQCNEIECEGKIAVPAEKILQDLPVKE